MRTQYNAFFFYASACPFSANHKYKMKKSEMHPYALPIDFHIRFVITQRLLCTFYFAGAQASGANVHMTRSSLHNRFYTLYVRLPCSVRASVRVRNLNTEGNTLSANFTFSHPTAPPYLSWHGRPLPKKSLQTNISLLTDSPTNCKTLY